MRELMKDNFYERTYWNWVAEKVFVYPYKRNIGKPEIWTIEQARQYVNYLEQNERANQQRD